MPITLSFTTDDMQLAIAARFDIELTEDEVAEFLHQHQNDLEDAMSAACWDIIEDTFQDELAKYTAN